MSIAFCFGISAATVPPQAVLDLRPHTKHGRLGAVASENRVCSQIGIELLQTGGNAADAVGECLSVPQAKLTAKSADWDHFVHWRTWSANPPELQYNTAENTQTAIIAA